MCPVSASHLAQVYKFIMISTMLGLRRKLPWCAQCLQVTWPRCTSSLWSAPCWGPDVSYLDVPSVYKSPGHGVQEMNRFSMTSTMPEAKHKLPHCSWCQQFICPRYTSSAWSAPCWGPDVSYLDVPSVCKSLGHGVQVQHDQHHAWHKLLHFAAFLQATWLRW